MPQTAKQLDKTTLIKIGKGALIAGVGAVGLFILGALGQIDMGNPLLTSFIAWLLPTATNFIKEWLKGAKVETPKVHT